jgi:hypothetical protein
MIKMAKKRRRTVKKTDTVPKGSSVEECVQNEIPHLIKAHPEFSREQAIAVAFSKCRERFGKKDSVETGEDSVESDALIIKKQMVAEEGVLPYMDGNKAKLWDDLKMNIGRIVPILDGHPNDENDNLGLYSGIENIHGYGFIKACETKKKLCADMLFFDGAPDRNGYSIGFPYVPDEKEGEIDGMQFTEVQGKLIVDHIALTDTPRNQNALKVFADSKEYHYHPVPLMEAFVTGDSLNGNMVVNISAVAYDSFRFQDNDLQQEQVRSLADIVNALREQNPDATDEEIIIHGSTMVKNQQARKKSKSDNNMVVKSKNNKDTGTIEEFKEEDQEEEENENSGTDSMDTEKDALRNEIALLKQKLAEHSEVDALKVENSNLKKKINHKDSIIKGFEKKESDDLHRTVIETIGGDEKVLSEALEESGIDSDSDFYKGILWAQEKLVTVAPDSGVEVDSGALASPQFKTRTTKAVKKKGQDANPSSNQYGRRWSFKLGKYVSKDEFTGE